nr:MAG TPA: hypothetical protein [Caudoviricetes sp.]
MRNYIPNLTLNGKKYYYDINENYSKRLDIGRLLINLKGSIILAVKKGLDSKEGLFGVINTGIDTFTVKVKEEKRTIYLLHMRIMTRILNLRKMITESFASAIIYMMNWN